MVNLRLPGSIRSGENPREDILADLNILTLKLRPHDFFGGARIGGALQNDQHILVQVFLTAWAALTI